MIPKEIYEKYHLADITEYETESVFYEAFLIQTDFIPNKILEGVATSADYADELYYRKIDGNVYSPKEYPAGWEKV